MKKLNVNIGYFLIVHFTGSPFQRLLPLLESGTGGGVFNLLNQKWARILI
jgi:hypothetical protein